MKTTGPRSGKIPTVRLMYLLLALTGGTLTGVSRYISTKGKTDLISLSPLSQPISSYRLRWQVKRLTWSA